MKRKFGYGAFRKSEFFYLFLKFKENISLGAFVLILIFFISAIPSFFNIYTALFSLNVPAGNDVYFWILNTKILAKETHPNYDLIRGYPLFFVMFLAFTISLLSPLNVDLAENSIISGIVLTNYLVFAAFVFYLTYYFLDKGFLYEEYGNKRNYSTSCQKKMVLSSLAGFSTLSITSDRFVLFIFRFLIPRTVAVTILPLVFFGIVFWVQHLREILVKDDYNESSFFFSLILLISSTIVLFYIHYIFYIVITLTLMLYLTLLAFFYGKRVTKIQVKFIIYTTFLTMPQILLLMKKWKNSLLNLFLYYFQPRSQTELTYGQFSGLDLLKILLDCFIEFERVSSGFALLFFAILLLFINFIANYRRNVLKESNKESMVLSVKFLLIFDAAISLIWFLIFFKLLRCMNAFYFAYFSCPLYTMSIVLLTLMLVLDNCFIISRKLKLSHVRSKTRIGKITLTRFLSIIILVILIFTQYSIVVQYTYQGERYISASHYKALLWLNSNTPKDVVILDYYEQRTPWDDVLGNWLISLSLLYPRILITLDIAEYLKIDECFLKINNISYIVISSELFLRLNKENLKLFTYINNNYLLVYEVKSEMPTVMVLKCLNT